MRGEVSREGRASGGALKKQSCKNVESEARGAHPDNEPDNATSRGAGRIFRKGGGKIGKFATGGALKRAFGGSAIGGGGKKPSMGRAARARGGGVGADLHPKTHEGGSGPKGRHLMADSEAEPPRE